MSRFKSPKYLFLGVLGIFAAYTIVILWSVWPIDSKTIAQSGVFGDSFGVLTSLFSGLAFAALIITIWQQQDDIELNRNEIKIQHFENMLFRMMEMHNNIIMDIDLISTKTTEKYKAGEVVATGRDCFRIFHGHLSQIYSLIKRKHPEYSDDELISKAYDVFWRAHKKDLGHYFRYLYNLISLIDDSDAKNKKKYTNIVRAQLSDYELSLLLYNCNSQHGREKFKPLVEKYNLLNNLPIDFLLNVKHKELFSEKAFL